jgi:tight adherence protein C
MGSMTIVALLSALSAAGVFLFVLAVFHQPAAARQAAEAEHAMENAAVSNPVLDSGGLGALLFPLVVLAHHVHAPQLKRRIRRELTAAGRQYEYTSTQWLSLTFVGAMIGVPLGLYVQLAITEDWGFIGAAMGLGLGWYAPLYHLRAKAQARLRHIERRLPYALDLISLSMTAGATFLESVDTLTRDDPDDPLNQEFRTMMVEMDLGRTRREALLNASTRVPLETLRTVVTSITSAEELGTPLADILKVQANLLRMARSHRAEKLAGEAAVKLLIPSMLVLLSVVLTIMSPFIIRFLRGDLY